MKGPRATTVTSWRVTGDKLYSHMDIERYGPTCRRYTHVSKEIYMRDTWTKTENMTAQDNPTPKYLLVCVDSGLDMRLALIKP